mgnify:CR=1 FL=1
MSFYKRFQKNILQFPKAKNKEALDQDQKTTMAVLTIEKQMTEDSWDVQYCPDYILNILAQFGEVIEFKPIVARRLIANLATELAKKRLEATNPYGDLI